MTLSWYGSQTRYCRRKLVRLSSISAGGGFVGFCGGGWGLGCGATAVWTVGWGEGLSSKPGSFFLRYSRPWSNIFNCSQRSNLTTSELSGSDKNMVYLANIIVNNYLQVFLSTIMLMKTQDIGSWLLAVGFWVKAKATAQPT